MNVLFVIGVAFVLAGTIGFYSDAAGRRIGLPGTRSQHRRFGIIASVAGLLLMYAAR